MSCRREIIISDSTVRVKYLQNMLPICPAIAMSGNVLLQENERDTLMPQPLITRCHRMAVVVKEMRPYMTAIIIIVSSSLHSAHSQLHMQRYQCRIHSNADHPSASFLAARDDTARISDHSERDVGLPIISQVYIHRQREYNKCSKNLLGAAGASSEEKKQRHNVIKTGTIACPTYSQEVSSELEACRDLNGTQDILPEFKIPLGLSALPNPATSPISLWLSTHHLGQPSFLDLLQQQLASEPFFKSTVPARLNSFSVLDFLSALPSYPLLAQLPQQHSSLLPLARPLHSLPSMSYVGGINTSPNLQV
ncbi:hypothetical protein CEUSTIGMA_g2031.t1 [Chlamydomonas eustigma]|uniref:Uncharacterized protein n=1 Tax=Chlamydomonas eustigma TaxID=1157962 RepID=A0A250WVD4_9CHLO|nr:hypothetical protein CEUSTIGMA_g2031.t1 [Chlamydomonas eustigma]|eukprot:GAX74582.1 hypothetical protein CEUSTIGMA_g2031.t1 [Chlamydomonas eustigma]